MALFKPRGLVLGEDWWVAVVLVGNNHYTA